ncbi:MAG: hypothetical protein F6K41_14635 [Symploca sp. SIO3E6]|nr:hypothetical protein [Caldora sp. SIO3E6]
MRGKYDPPTPLVDVIEQVKCWLEVPTLVLLSENPGYWESLRDRLQLQYYISFGKETQNLLHEVYGQYTAPALMHLTHQELPWKKTTITEEISHSLMKTYFESQLVK